MRQRQATGRSGGSKNVVDYGQAGGNAYARKTGKKRNNRRCAASFFVVLFLVVITVQIVLNPLLYGGPGRSHGYPTQEQQQQQQPREEEYINTKIRNSYDVLLKNTIHYGTPNDNNNNNNNNDANNGINDTGAVFDARAMQEQINNLRSEISALESKSKKYVDDPRFFPFVIRDSRHLTPVQIDPDFHVFDYVDLTQARQPKSKHSQLLHNARLVIDNELEEKRKKPSKKKASKYAEKYEAPCQVYSIGCYREKVLQVFSYILRKFPSVEYYFYVEADNDLCVPMTMVKDLALTEQRYFINTGIGFSGWIMSREFLKDFIELYGNATLDAEIEKSSSETNAKAKANNATEGKQPEIRPDVLASYYLTDKQAWTVTRQYWVSHTTLESIGIASLTVKDRRANETGQRMKLDKHLPRCLEPRRGKWKVSRRRPYLDPRDRFGWDYFDYEVCPNDLLFPCGGQDQLKKLVADDLRVANQTGALAKWKQIAEKREKKEEAKAAEKARAQKEKEDQTAAPKNANNHDIKERMLHQAEGFKDLVYEAKGKMRLHDERHRRPDDEHDPLRRYLDSHSLDGLK